MKETGGSHTTGVGSIAPTQTTRRHTGKNCRRRQEFLLHTELSLLIVALAVLVSWDGRLAGNC